MLLFLFVVDVKWFDKVVVSGVERKVIEKYRFESCCDIVLLYKILLFIYFILFWLEGNSGIVIDFEFFLFSNLGCFWFLLMMVRIGKRKGSRSCCWFF